MSSLTQHHTPQSIKIVRPRNTSTSRYRDTPLNKGNMKPCRTAIVRFEVDNETTQAQIHIKGCCRLKSTPDFKPTTFLEDHISPNQNLETLI